MVENVISFARAKRRLAYVSLGYALGYLLRPRSLPAREPPLSGRTSAVRDLVLLLARKHLGDRK
jgi:hypothetical protein